MPEIKRGLMVSMIQIDKACSERRSCQLESVAALQLRSLGLIHLEHLATEPNGTTPL